MNDELLYDPARLTEPLVPYRCGLPCWHQLQESHQTPPAAANGANGACDREVSAAR